MILVDATARKMAILELFQEQNILKITNLSDKFDVSRETIRRDFAELESEGKVKLIRGGAVLNVSDSETPYERRLNIMHEEKEKIAENFCSMLKDNMTIYLDYGTTCLEVARKIKRFKNLTVITNSLPIINELYKVDAINLYVLGGMVRKNEGSFVGEQINKVLQNININIGFFSGSGIDYKFGLSNYNFDESNVTRNVINRCQKIVVGIDSSKFGSIFPQNIINLKDIDTIITTDMDEELLEKYSEKTKVILTDENEV